MALQEPLMKKSSFAEIFIPPLGNSLFCYHRLECIRIRIEESKEIVQKETLRGFRLLLSIERSSKIERDIHVPMIATHNEQQICETIIGKGKIYTAGPLVSSGRTSPVKMTPLFSVIHSVINELYDLELTRPQICTSWNARVALGRLRVQESRG